MSPRRSKYLDQATRAALRNVAVLEAAIAAYEFAVRVGDNRTWGGYPREFKPDPELRAYLWRKRSEAQQQALMFGNLSTNEELQREAWRLAGDFIVRENSMIMQYLYTDNQNPSMYLQDVQTGFRREIHAAIREKLGLDPEADLEAFYAGFKEEEDLDDPEEPEEETEE